MKLMSRTIIAGLVLSAAATSFPAPRLDAQPSQKTSTWTRKVADPPNGAVQFVGATVDGNALVLSAAGTAYSLTLLRPDATTGWTRTYSTKGAQFVAGAGDGTVAVLGTPDLIFGVDGPPKVIKGERWVQKLNEDGSVAWAKTIWPEVYFAPWALHADEKRIIIAGQSEKRVGVHIALDARTGVLVFSKKFFTSDPNNRITAIHRLRNGSYVATLAGTGARIFAFTADGRVLWRSGYGISTATGAWAVTQLADGDLMTTGFRGTDTFVSRFSPNGKLRWTRAYGTPLEDRAYVIAPASDGVAIVALVSDQTAYHCEISGSGRLTFQQSVPFPIEVSAVDGHAYFRTFAAEPQVVGHFGGAGASSDCPPARADHEFVERGVVRDEDTSSRTVHEEEFPVRLTDEKGGENLRRCITPPGK